MSRFRRDPSRIDHNELLDEGSESLSVEGLQTRKKEESTQERKRTRNGKERKDERGERFEWHSEKGKKARNDQQQSQEGEY